MLGDGINDSTALAIATVGVAMGETSAALAANSADLVLMTDKLQRLTQCINQTLSLCPLDWTVEYYPSVLRETCRGWICSCRWIGIVDGDCGRSGNFVAGLGAWTFSSVKTFLDRLWFGGVFGLLVALSLCLVLSTSHLHLSRNMQFNKWHIMYIRTIRY